MIKKIVSFYVEGFKNMQVGKTLWLIIFIKLFIMFAILKVFFFPNFMKTHFQTDEQRSSYVIDRITNSNTN